MKIEDKVFSFIDGNKDFTIIWNGAARDVRAAPESGQMRV
jgi:hypothetical protein